MRIAPPGIGGGAHLDSGFGDFRGEVSVERESALTELVLQLLNSAAGGLRVGDN
jgi:hypothetical protein